MHLSFDLQSHSTYSDGELAPRVVVGAAVGAGVDLFALTDHDTVEGIDEALEAAVGTELTLIPAIELSIVDEVAPDIHVLGYGIDHHDAALLESLDRFRADRAERTDRMIDRMRAEGFELDAATIEQRRGAGLPIGRPHLAEAVLLHDANTQRLADEAIVTVSDLIRGYLIEGKAGFAGRTMPSATDAIDVIHAAGGVAVWAHPFWDIADPAVVISTLDRYHALGLDGLEVFYVEHDERQTRLLHEAATQRGLLRTGSSDFHGPGHPLFARMRAFETYGLEPELGSLPEPPIPHDGVRDTPYRPVPPVPICSRYPVERKSDD